MKPTGHLFCPKMILIIFHFFCSIVEHTNKKDCEGAGGVWSEMNVDTDFSQIDTSPLTDELLKQIEELDKCFADPVLQEYLESL